MRRVLRIIRVGMISLIVVVLATILTCILLFFYLNSTGKITGPVLSFMNSYVDGEMNFKRVHFNIDELPYIKIKVDQGYFVTNIKNYPNDTLCTFDCIETKINPLKILTDDLIDIPYVRAHAPMVNVFLDKNGRSNWNLWDFYRLIKKKPAKKSPEQTTKESGKPSIEIDIAHVEVYDGARYRYENKRDDMSMGATADYFILDGRIAIDYMLLDADSLNITGLDYYLDIPQTGLSISARSDTARLKKAINADVDFYDFYVSTYNNSVTIKHQSILKSVNVGMSGRIGVVQRYNTMLLSNYRVTVDDTSLHLEGKIRGYDDAEKNGIIDAELTYNLNTSNVDSMLYALQLNKIPELSKYKFGFPMKVTGHVDGEYNMKGCKYPDISARMVIPQGSFKYPGLPPLRNLKSIVMVDFHDKPKKDLQIAVDRFYADMMESAIAFTGKAGNMFADPLLEFIVESRVSLEDVNKVVLKKAYPQLYGELYFVSQLDGSLRSFETLDIPNIKGRGEVQLNNCVALFPDSATIISVNKFVTNFTNLQKDINGEVCYFNDLGDLRVEANNLAIYLKDKLSFQTDSLSIETCLSDLRKDSLLNVINASVNCFDVYACNEGQDTARVQSLQSSFLLNDLFAKKGLSEFDITMALNGVFVTGRAMKMVSEDIGLVFKGDKMINGNGFLDDWNYAGALLLDSSQVYTPYLPLRNSVRNLELLFSPNTVRFRDLTLESGFSKIRINGELDNWQNFLLKTDTLMGRFNVESERLDLNQLVPSLARGLQLIDHHKDEEMKSFMEKKPTADLIKKSLSKKKLIYIPDNINLKLKLMADNIIYDGIPSMESTGEILVAAQQIQLNDFQLNTYEVGDVCLDAGYYTPNREFAYGWMSINIEQLNVRKLVQIVPDLGQVVPILQTMKGYVDCDIIANSRFDSIMMPHMPSLYALGRIKGHNMSVEKNRILPGWLGKLLLRKKPDISIDSISVDIEVKDSIISVYPFIANIGRYEFSASGVQNLDNSFFYHFSLLKWPLWFKLGFNVYGNPGNMHFSFACPRLTNLSLPARILSTSTARLYPSNDMQQTFLESVMEQQRAFDSLNSYYHNLYIKNDMNHSKKEQDMLNHLENLRSEVKGLMQK